MTSFWGSLFLGSFINEDLSFIASIVLYYKDKITLAESASSVFLGIIISDLILFYLGRWSQKYFPEKIINLVDFKFKNYHLVNYLIYISRVVPFLRLPTFFIAGLSKLKLSEFLKNLVLSVFVWLLLGFILGRSLQKLVIYSRPVLALVVFVLVGFFHLLLPKILSKIKNS